MLGGPGPDATQWAQIARVADCGSGVLARLERLAAQGERLSQDDTPVRRGSLSEANHQAPSHAEARGVSRSEDRTGMDTTAWVVKVGEQPMGL